MADETTPEVPATETQETQESHDPNGDAAALATIADVAAMATINPDEPVKLKQTVEIKDVGPCRKHVKVTVEREQIDQRFDEKYTEILRGDQPPVRGFRPRKAPRKLIEKQYRESVSEEIKTQVLMASLEQLADEQLIAPLSPPDLNPYKIKIPETGPFIYEFEIEVRPEFELPNYKGLKLRRPTHTFTDAEIAAEQKRLLEPHGQIVPKEPAVVELNDYIVADASVSFGGKEINKLQEVRIKVEKQLALSDGLADDFGAKLVGAKPGDVREVDITLSPQSGSEHLTGRKVQATFTVKDVKTTRLPELTTGLLEGVFGVSTVDGLKEFVQTVLERRLEYTQRQAARSQVLEHISAASTWELPRDMLTRQARKTLQRRVMEMKNAGMSEAQIQGRRRLIEQDSVKNTEAALKEHFVLQKIADVEKIEIDDDDLDREIERIAYQAGESVRKVRARYEKDDLMEAVAADLLERRALDLILSGATYEDYEWKVEEQGDEVATISAGAAPPAEDSPALPAGDVALDDKTPETPPA